VDFRDTPPLSDEQAVALAIEAERWAREHSQERDA
jgi:hypothetical protein